MLSYDRWNQYRYYFFPGLKLSRNREDVCDACVRLDTLLLDPRLTIEERESYEAEKSKHVGDAVAQRRK